MGLLEDLQAVFGDIPRYVWEPIARQESGLNPLAWNQAGEDSRGLFQINLDAHPDLAGTDLFDPITNARIARDRFIGPAYQEIAWHPDPAYQTAYVWQHGIRPNWDLVQQKGADQRLMDDARKIAAGTTISTGETPAVELPAAGGLMDAGFWSRAGLLIVYVLGLILLLVAGGYGIAKAFGADPMNLIPAGRLLKGGK